MKICIDAGHGGHDSGAVGPAGLEEAPTVLQISQTLAAWLREEYGLETKLTRNSNVYIQLNVRCDIANDWPADYFISIHANSDGPSAHGIETLYTSDKGKKLADPIQKALIEATGETDRGLKERDDLAVLNGTNMPAALVEVGFISHPETEEKLGTLSYRDLLADAIVQGIIKFLGWEPK